jgi:adenosylcobinamide kinase/adenosylcobinamide-phosphate guanylyltransferase
MAARIGRHRAERGPRWRTRESPLDLAAALDDPDTVGIVVDCLTLWTSNQLFAHEPAPGADAAAAGAPTDAAIEARAVAAATALAADPRPVVVVTNEVGLGIVPDNALARRYRDLLGRVNQRFAAVATEVTFLVAGIPLKVR